MAGGTDSGLNSRSGRSTVSARLYESRGDSISSMRASLGITKRDSLLAAGSALKEMRQFAFPLVAGADLLRQVPFCGRTPRRIHAVAVDDARSWPHLVLVLNVTEPNQINYLTQFVNWTRGAHYLNIHADPPSNIEFCQAKPRVHVVPLLEEHEKGPVWINSRGDHARRAPTGRREHRREASG